MPRFFLPPGQIDGERFFLEGSEAHHAVAVYRFSVGDAIDLFDGKDRSYRGRIDAVHDRRIEGTLLDSQAAAPGRRTLLRLYAALIKGPRWDWLVQKCCEVGVDVLIPLKTSRTVVRLEGKEMESKIDRWQRIALEAAKQCGRTTPMRVEAPMSFAAALAAVPAGELILFPWEKESARTLRDACAGYEGPQAHLWIGPEGGWEAEEARQAQARGAQTVTLGARLLRSETAAIVAAALVDLELD